MTIALPQERWNKLEQPGTRVEQARAAIVIHPREILSLYFK
jgi:hypothetical protein